MGKQPKGVPLTVAELGAAPSPFRVWMTYHRDDDPSARIDGPVTLERSGDRWECVEGGFTPWEGLKPTDQAAEFIHGTTLLFHLAH